tara:strand:- start:147 stop:473 length:327 start_codon:yes stop_codon:yes gene_type:complete
MTVAKTIPNKEIRDQIAENGSAVSVSGSPFSISIRTDHNAIFEVIVQGSVDNTFDNLWEIDRFSIAASSAGIDLFYQNSYDNPQEYVRVVVTAQSTPTEGDMDAWVIK